MIGSSRRGNLRVQEVVEIANHLSEGMRLPVLLIACCQLRVGEVLALSREDIIDGAAGMTLCVCGGALSWIRLELVSSRPSIQVPRFSCPRCLLSRFESIWLGANRSRTASCSSTQPESLGRLWNSVGPSGRHCPLPAYLYHHRCTGSVTSCWDDVAAESQICL